jgi:hypothetical protein
MFSFQVVAILEIILQNYVGRCDFRIPVAQPDKRSGPKCDNPVLRNFGHELMGATVTGLSRVGCSSLIASEDQTQQQCCNLLYHPGYWQQSTERRNTT